MQQLVRLRTLLHPTYRGVAFVFASGKALRTLMPFLLIALLLGSALLAPSHWMLGVLFLAQAIVYSLAFVVKKTGPERAPAPLQILHYLIQGHLAGLIGAMRYLTKQDRGRWVRAKVAVGG